MLDPEGLVFSLFFLSGATVCKGKNDSLTEKWRFERRRRMKTVTDKFGRGQIGNGPFMTASDRKRGIWFAIAVIVVYAILGVFYIVAMG